MRFLKSEAGAIILWLAASLFAAVLLTPHLYDAGETLAESAETKDYPKAIESIVGSAGRAKIDRYFSRSLLFSALALLPFLSTPISPPSSLRQGYDRQAGPTQWLFQKPPAESKLLAARFTDDLAI